MMRAALRWIARGLLAVVLLIALGIGYLWFSNRDIPMAQLEQEYGGDGLQRLEVDGVNLAYRVSGEGPPVVLIHSHFYTMRQWQAWTEQLSKHFTVIRYDLTSHGLTGPDPTGDYSYDRGVELLTALLDHLGIETAALVGSSTGGAVARRFAATHRDRVSALVLINTPGMPRPANPYMEKGMPDWFGYVFYLLPERVFKPFLASAVANPATITDELARETHRMYRGEGNRWAEFERMSSWKPSDISAELQLISAPTLILWGEDNPQLPVTHAALYREQMTNAASITTVIYPGVGHVIPLEVPEKSAADTIEFLEQLP
jgi:pimeloyl-ACP methyl ester carboxylesterase